MTHVNNATVNNEAKGGAGGAGGADGEGGVAMVIATPAPDATSAAAAAAGTSGGGGGGGVGVGFDSVVPLSVVGVTPLPPVIHDVRTCERCFERSACMLYHKAMEGGTTETSGLKDDMYQQLTAHITKKDQEYFRLVS